MVLMCGSGVPTANLHFAKVFLMRLFLERFKNGYEKQGGETNTVDDNNLE